MENGFIIVLEVVIGLVSAYLLYYVHKKGQNQADKEDLKKLTKIVEDVKMKNSKEIESIRANLSLLTDKRKQIFNEEKDSIVVFFAQLNTWIWKSLNINIDSFNLLNVEDIPKALIEMQNAYNNTKVSYSKVMLIINDTQLVQAGQDVIEKTNKVHNLRIGLLNVFYLNLHEINIQRNIFKSHDNTDIENIFDVPSLNQKISLLIKENTKIRNEFKDNQVDFNTAMKAVEIFQDLARDYIRK